MFVVFPLREGQTQRLASLLSVMVRCTTTAHSHCHHSHCHHSHCHHSHCHHSHCHHCHHCHCHHCHHRCTLVANGFGWPFCGARSTGMQKKNNLTIQYGLPLCCKEIKRFWFLAQSVRWDPSAVEISSRALRFQRKFSEKLCAACAAAHR